MYRLARPKLLIIAYACEPGKGSEQGVGWNWALQLARFADITVITRANNRATIEAAMARRGASNPRFIYYDPSNAILQLKRKARGLYPFYALWQWGSYRLARRLHAEHRYSHVMQLTFGSIWMPVFVHRLPTRFIWGPIGGGEGIPRNIENQVAGRARFVQALRRVLIATLPVNPFIAPVLARADRILVRTQDTLDILPPRARVKASCILETGIDDATLAAVAPAPTKTTKARPVVLFTGRFVGFKNVEMLLHAAAKAHDDGAQFQLRLVGDGSERRALETLVARLGLGALVDFVGMISHEDVLDELRNADVYAFPSLREGGPWSLMEAMCAALPVVCLETSGMSVITDDTCAIRVAPVSRELIISGLAKGISALCADPELRARLGSAARKRMHEVFLWDRKGEEAARLLFGPDEVAGTRVEATDLAP